MGGKSRGQWGTRAAACLLLGLAALCLVFAAKPAETGAEGGGQVLEQLNYQVNIWIFNDSVPATLVFKRLASGCYRAEVTGQARGLLAVLSGNFKGAYVTDMVFADGHFKPTVYREQTERRGKLHVVEYRFNYQDKRVEVWKWDRGKRALVQKWQTAMERPMYDPLSFYYNQRLRLRDAKEGDVVRLPGIPYPKPEDVVFQIGPLTSEGRRVTITLDTSIVETEGKKIFALLDQEGVATQAWAKLMRFGKVSGTLLPGGKRLNLQEILEAKGPLPGAPGQAALQFAATPAGAGGHLSRWLGKKNF